VRRHFFEEKLCNSAVGRRKVLIYQPTGVVAIVEGAVRARLRGSGLGVSRRGCLGCECSTWNIIANSQF
jgi:hypothetical protein